MDVGHRSLRRHASRAPRSTTTDDPDGRRIIRSYAWDLSDLIRTNQGLPRLLVEGTSPPFEEAEELVREHVGKCYDPRLGYRRFAGSLAFTFTLSTGERVDVAEYIGTRCAVTVLMPDRSERTVTGDFDVSHYKWRLASPEEVLEIVPEHVMRITNRSEAAERATAITRNDRYSGIGRMYREEPKPGCTGTAGVHDGYRRPCGCAAMPDPRDRRPGSPAALRRGASTCRSASAGTGRAWTGPTMPCRRPVSTSSVVDELTTLAKKQVTGAIELDRQGARRYRALCTCTRGACTRSGCEGYEPRVGARLRGIGRPRRPRARDDRGRVGDRRRGRPRWRPGGACGPAVGGALATVHQEYLLASLGAVLACPKLKAKVRKGETSRTPCAPCRCRSTRCST